MSNITARGSSTHGQKLIIWPVPWKNIRKPMVYLTTQICWNCSSRRVPKSARILSYAFSTRRRTFPPSSGKLQTFSTINRKKCIALGMMTKLFSDSRALRFSISLIFPAGLKFWNRVTGFRPQSTRWLQTFLAVSAGAIRKNTFPEKKKVRCNAFSRWNSSISARGTGW